MFRGSLVPAGRNTSALVVGLPDSGFFPDEDSAPCNYASKMKIIYDMGHMQASAHPQCVQENKGHEHRCIFAQWLLPHIQVRPAKSVPRYSRTFG